MYIYKYTYPTPATHCNKTTPCNTMQHTATESANQCQFALTVSTENVIDSTKNAFLGCYPPQIHPIEKLRFIGTNSNWTKSSIRIGRAKYLGI